MEYNIVYYTQTNYYSRTSLIRTPGTIEFRSSYPEFVLTDVICIENALKGTEIVFVFINRKFVLTVFVLTRFYCMSMPPVAPMGFHSLP